MSDSNQDINVKDGLVETNRDIANMPMANEDIMPSPISERTWGAWDIAALWIGMSIVVTTYAMASGMIAQGMNWWQALLAVTLGNLLIFFPLALNGHAGTKFGVPFPVLVRSSFGVHGAHIPAVFRGLVACGWFGIQSWIGGRAIHKAMVKFVNLTGLTIWPLESAQSVFWGQQYGIWLGFFIFWGICMWIVWMGIESIRVLEDYGAPFLILCFGGLFVWAWWAGGGFTRVLTEGMERIGAAGGLPMDSWSFWKVFIPSLMAMIGYWATLSLNIPDFTRYVKSQKDQVVGQFCGLNLTMGPFAFLGAFVTAAAFLIFMPQFSANNLEQFLNKHPQYASAINLSESTTNYGNVIAGWEDETKVENTKAVSAAAALDVLSSEDVPGELLRKHAGDLEGDVEIGEDRRTSLEALSADQVINLYSSVKADAGEDVASVLAFNEAGGLPYLQAQSRAKSLWRPTELLGTFQQPLVVIVIMVALAVATLTTNMAANVVAPANSFSNLAPQAISFRIGGLVTGILGILSCPWILYSNPNYYLNVWLVGIAGLLAPIGGIMIGDYFVYRGTHLSLNELFESDGKYHYHGGFNLAGILTLLISVACLLPGFVFTVLGYGGPFDPSLSVWMKPFAWIYLSNWIFGFVFSLICYIVLVKGIYGPADEEPVGDGI
jgi:cytosine/uracil/thiamine/allantoin permease